MPVTTLEFGTDEGYTDAGDVGFNDPFPGLALNQQSVRNLVETRKAAMANVASIQAVGVPTWNDVMFAFRSVYAKARSLGTAPPNLLAAYSPCGQFGYGAKNSYGNAAAANGTDVTGKTVTFPSSVNTPVGALGNATGGSVLTINAGVTKGIVVVGLMGVGDPTVFGSHLYAMRTDGSNYVRAWRQSATNVRFESNVATTVATIADYTVASTEQVSGSAIAIRINADNTYGVWYNGVRLGTGTLAAGPQGLTGTLIGSAFDVPAGHMNAEIEAWSTTPPYQTK